MNVGAGNFALRAVHMMVAKNNYFLIPLENVALRTDRRRVPKNNFIFNIPGIQSSATRVSLRKNQPNKKEKVIYDPADVRICVKQAPALVGGGSGPCPWIRHRAELKKKACFHS